jgi:arginine/lysine/ornithine decarboxylase
MVDNAHGAYLKFLPSSLHPTDLGADICCDSAHKTLPCITGGAYLHITRNAPKLFSEQARNALSLFGSTSPSYLILQSLDAVNKYISDGYAEKLASLTDKLNECKQALTAYGYTLIGNEPLKLTVHAKKYGYRGTEIADILRGKNIEPEFADPDTLVLMIAPENRDYGLISLFEALISIPKRPEILTEAPRISSPVTAVGLRKAMLSPSERVPVSEALGRILASASVACPPAVPITVCGEVIDATALGAYNYYGIEYVNVIKER